MRISDWSSDVCSSDRGSRTVRDEIAAMQVMAVDPIHRVVVPRVVGASIAAGLMTGIVIMGGLAGGFLYSVVLKGSNVGAYMDGFSTLAQMADLGLALAKGRVFGVVDAVIAAWRGLYAKGGAGGGGLSVEARVEGQRGVGLLD